MLAAEGAIECAFPFFNLVQWPKILIANPLCCASSGRQQSEPHPMEERTEKEEVGFPIAHEATRLIRL